MGYWGKSPAVAAAMMFAALPAAALAQGAVPGALQWDCTQQYDQQFHVRCVPRRPEALAEPQHAADPAPMRVAATGPRARDLRPVAYRDEAEVFGVPAWNVPLHAPPLDAEFATQLLRAVLCGKVPACEIRYSLPEVRAFGFGSPARVGRRP